MLKYTNPKRPKLEADLINGVISFPSRIYTTKMLLLYALPHHSWELETSQRRHASRISSFQTGKVLSTLLYPLHWTLNISSMALQVEEAEWPDLSGIWNTEQESMASKACHRLEVYCLTLGSTQENRKKIRETLID